MCAYERTNNQFLKNERERRRRNTTTNKNISQIVLVFLNNQTIQIKFSNSKETSEQRKQWQMSPLDEEEEKKKKTRKGKLYVRLCTMHKDIYLFCISLSPLDDSIHIGLIKL